jgi:hypothetical protein
MAFNSAQFNPFFEKNGNESCGNGAGEGFPEDLNLIVYSSSQK